MDIFDSKYAEVSVPKINGTYFDSGYAIFAVPGGENLNYFDSQPQTYFTVGGVDLAEFYNSNMYMVNGEFFDNSTTVDFGIRDLFAWGVNKYGIPSVPENVKVLTSRVINQSNWVQ